MNRRQATKWRTKARKEWKRLKRIIMTTKPHMKPRWRQSYKAFTMRCEAEFRKEMENERTRQKYEDDRPMHIL